MNCQRWKLLLHGPVSKKSWEFLPIYRITIPKEKLINLKKTLKISTTVLSQGNCVSKYNSECQYLAKFYILADNFKYLKENIL